jgi:DNA-binding PadR family transcriptional regulator
MFHKYSLPSNPRPDAPFRRGLFKFIVLQYLQEKPSHGYEIIQVLTRRFHGLYAPSPGTVYPRLSKLEGEGYIGGVDREGRKVYTITEKGSRFLTDNPDLEREVNERLSDWENPRNIEDIKKTMREFARLGEMLTWEIRKMDFEKLKKVQDELIRTRERLENILQDKVAQSIEGHLIQE